MRVRCRLVGTGNNIFIDISDRGADPDLTATGATITIGVPDANGVAILSPRADE